MRPHILRRGVEIVAIHQPNFLPWLGWFDKLARADVFVLLDHVQFPRTSRGTYVNRVKLLVGGKDAWVTAPIVRASGSAQRIDEVRLDGCALARKVLRTWSTTTAARMRTTRSTRSCMTFSSSRPIGSRS